ncbi:MAG: hypothetical protein AAF498_07165, partial [Pseudomonadota bacterium]
EIDHDHHDIKNGAHGLWAFVFELISCLCIPLRVERARCLRQAILSRWLGSLRKQTNSCSTDSSVLEQHSTWQPLTA